MKAILLLLFVSFPFSICCPIMPDLKLGVDIVLQ